jgi:two-component system CheB/CheR fusion protein
MNHRIRNLFALASGMVALSARSAETPEAMAEAVRARLAALARAHGLTLPRLAGAGAGPESGATLESLIRTIVEPYLEADRAAAQRVTIEGPEVAIGGNAVTGLALLLHEFATNAAKYGALSTPAGRVDVGWTLAADQLLLTWREHGGPPLAGGAASEGFGSLLARGTVRGQFGGEITHDWRPEGLVVRLTLPLQRLA